ncbi:MAG TPA: hypothetical protein VM890_05580, partial [Longimicrobium sp.]|nr:hypothetical protein [Longimicrobium sp.]
MRAPALLAFVAIGVVFGGGRTASAAEPAPRPHTWSAPAAAPPAHPDTQPRRRGSAGKSRPSSTRSRAEAVLRTSRAVVSAARPETGPHGQRVQRALARLGSRVNTSDRDALRMAFRAYYAYRAAHPEKARKPYLYFVDYG